MALAPVTVPAVADALRHISITGVFYCPSYLREPWGGTVPPIPGCVWFHAVTSGRCELIVGSDRRVLESGDLALVPHGAGHRIEAGGPTDYPIVPDLPHDEQSDHYAVLHYGGDGPLTELVCGGLRLEHPSARRLLDGLRPSSTSAPLAVRRSMPRSICSPRRYGAAGSEARRSSAGCATSSSSKPFAIG